MISPQHVRRIFEIDKTTSPYTCKIGYSSEGEAPGEEFEFLIQENGDNFPILETLVKAFVNTAFIDIDKLIVKEIYEIYFINGPNTEENSLIIEKHNLFKFSEPVELSGNANIFEKVLINLLVKEKIKKYNQDLDNNNVSLECLTYIIIDLRWICDQHKINVGEVRYQHIDDQPYVFDEEKFAKIIESLGLPPSQNYLLEAIKLLDKAVKKRQELNLPKHVDLKARDELDALLDLDDKRKKEQEAKKPSRYNLDRFKAIAEALSPQHREDVDSAIYQCLTAPKELEKLLSQRPIPPDIGRLKDNYEASIKQSKDQLTLILQNLNNLSVCTESPKRSYRPLAFRQNLQNVFEILKEFVTITGDNTLKREIDKIQKVVDGAGKEIPKSKARAILDAFLTLLPRVFLAMKSFIEDMNLTFKASLHQVEGYDNVVSRLSKKIWKP
jgi:hypothetical protein